MTKFVNKNCYKKSSGAVNRSENKSYQQKLAFNKVTCWQNLFIEVGNKSWYLNFFRRVVNKRVQQIILKILFNKNSEKNLLIKVDD